MPATSRSWRCWTSAPGAARSRASAWELWPRTRIGCASSWWWIRASWGGTPGRRGQLRPAHEERAANVLDGVPVRRQEVPPGDADPARRQGSARPATRSSYVGTPVPSPRAAGRGLGRGARRASGARAFRAACRPCPCPSACRRPLLGLLLAALLLGHAALFVVLCGAGSPRPGAAARPDDADSLRAPLLVLLLAALLFGLALALLPWPALLFPRCAGGCCSSRLALLFLRLALLLSGPGGDGSSPALALLLGLALLLLAWRCCSSA